MLIFDYFIFVILTIEYYNHVFLIIFKLDINFIKFTYTFNLLVNVRSCFLIKVILFEYQDCFLLYPVIYLLLSIY